MGTSCNKFSLTNISSFRERQSEHNVIGEEDYIPIEEDLITTIVPYVQPHIFLADLNDITNCYFKKAPSISLKTSSLNSLASNPILQDSKALSSTHKKWYSLKEIAPGLSYEGETFEGKRHGKGKQVWNNGTCYEGEFIEDKAKGKGKLVHREGDYYEGQWDNDKANGIGIYVSITGARYDGQWKEDKQDGKGVETWPEGSKYEGEYKKGRKSGKGCFLWLFSLLKTFFKGRIEFPDKAWYKGDFLDNEIHGSGEYHWSDGRSYKGDWKEGKMDGKGETFWLNGRSYKGNYVKDKQEGLGVYRWDNGKVYWGFWKGGLQHGKGILLINKEKEVKGLWVEGIKARELEEGFEEIELFKRKEGENRF